MADSPVHVSPAVINELVAHAVESAPLECCGLLIGTATQIVQASRARNTLASRTRYQIEPADHFEAIRVARAGGLSVVGAYHSHPASAPEPSARDRREASYTDFVYVIIGLASPSGPEVRAFRFGDGNFTPVTLVP
jgi:proteasome lid subunit RPN8/RPN11